MGMPLFQRKSLSAANVRFAPFRPETFLFQFDFKSVSFYTT